MSLLSRIQEKKTVGLKDTPNPSQSINQPVQEVVKQEKIQKIPALKNAVPPKENEKKKQIKNLLQKQILQEIKETNNVDEIIPKIDEMAIEIIKEDESFRGAVDRKKIVEEVINDLTGFGPINPLLIG